MMNDKLEMKIENNESIMLAEHFIMPDEINTVRGNELDRTYPCVQIIYPSDMNSYQDNRVAESHPENGLTHNERKKYLFTISLNTDADY